VEPFAVKLRADDAGTFLISTYAPPLPDALVGCTNSKSRRSIGNQRPGDFFWHSAVPQRKKQSDERGGTRKDEHHALELRRALRSNRLAGDKLLTR
jgi:hypothetical protein